MNTVYIQNLLKTPSLLADYEILTSLPDMWASKLQTSTKRRCLALLKQNKQKREVRKWKCGPTLSLSAFFLQTLRVKVCVCDDKRGKNTKKTRAGRVYLEKVKIRES